MTLTRFWLCIATVLALKSASFSQTPTAAELLNSIKERPNLRSSYKPFHLEADFVAQLTKPETGHFTWKWLSKDEWQQEATFGSFHQVTVQKENKSFTARNLSFLPLPIREMTQMLIPVPVNLTEWEVKKVKQTEHGTIDCLELQRISDSKSKRELCVSATTGFVVSDEFKNDFESDRYEYSDYQSFESRAYPRTLKMIRNDVPVLTIVVTMLEEAAYSITEFVPPQNAVVRRTCSNMVPPKALKTPDPTYPRSELNLHLSGTSIVSLTVLPDGTVDDVHLIGSSYRGMDEMSQQIVKEWRFKPAMCGSEPVATDIQVQVNFRLR